MQNFNTLSPLPPSSFFVDVINVCFLCYGKCITRMKDCLSFFKFLKSIYSWLYYSWNCWHFLVHFFLPDDIARVVWASLFLFSPTYITYYWFPLLPFIFFCSYTFVEYPRYKFSYFLSLLIGAIYRVCGHVHKYQTHFWGFVQIDPSLSF